MVDVRSLHILKNFGAKGSEPTHAVVFPTMKVLVKEGSDVKATVESVARELHRDLMHKTTSCTACGCKCFGQGACDTCKGAVCEQCALGLVELMGMDTTLKCGECGTPRTLASVCLSIGCKSFCTVEDILALVAVVVGDIAPVELLVSAFDVSGEFALDVTMKCVGEGEGARVEVSGRDGERLREMIWSEGVCRIILIAGAQKKIVMERRPSGRWCRVTGCAEYTSQLFNHLRSNLSK